MCNRSMYFSQELFHFKSASNTRRQNRLSFQHTQILIWLERGHSWTKKINFRNLNRFFNMRSDDFVWLLASSSSICLSRAHSSPSMWEGRGGDDCVTAVQPKCFPWPKPSSAQSKGVRNDDDYSGSDNHSVILITIVLMVMICGGKQICTTKKKTANYNTCTDDYNYSTFGKE